MTRSASALLAMIRKDLAVFLTDRHAVVLSFLAPIFLASFMAAIFGGAGASSPSKIPIRIVDEDQSPVSKTIWRKSLDDPQIKPVRTDRQTATRAALAGHAFAGMVVQFVLFSAIEWGVGLSNERRKGLWKRLRSAPVSSLTLITSKVVGCAIVSAMITLVAFGFGAAVFGVRIRGSWIGFGAITAAYAFTAATFGLMVASLGRTPQAARSVAILAVLVMVLLGGGWIPSFLFPQWLQSLTPAIPTRWAIDGFDRVLSKGFRLSETLPTLAALIAFATAFGAVALVRCPWDEA